MTTLTSEARNRLDEYLGEMRASMAASTPAEMAEIEQDIRDHVDAELANRSSPAPKEELDLVLDRLGDPRRWASDTAPTGHASLSSNVSFESWLAYASAGSMLLFLAAPPLLLISWLLARWALQRIEDSGQELGARRWLLYPPILLVVAPVMVITLLWAFAPAGELGASLFVLTPPSSPSARTLATVVLALAGLGAYWIVLGAIAAFGDRLVRFLLYPFAKGFRRRHGWSLSGVGAALAAVAVATSIFLRGR
jgi:hypothetical protein